MITGFSSPAEGYGEKRLDLNTFLIKHPNATSFMKIGTNNYKNFGIYCGDLIIIDRAIKVGKNSLVVYEKEGRFVLGWFGNINIPTVISGVVVHVIHTVRSI